MKKQFLKLADIILVVVILLSVFLYLGLNKGDSPLEAIIYSDGKEYARLNLDIDQEITVNNVKIAVKEGKVSVIESTCPDGLCKNFPSIKNQGSTIACVPNNVVITVVKNKNYVDGVTG